MKYSNFYKSIAVAGVLSLAVIVACEKKLDKTNPSYPTLTSYFKNADELQKGVNSVYSIFRAGNMVGREWFFVHDLRSDDDSAGGGQLELPRAQIIIGAADPANSVMNAVWNSLYTIIHRANTVIVSAPNVTDNTTVRDQCLGEAKFFRAWALFELVSVWGPAPMYLKPVETPSDFQPRATVDAMYTQIIADLTEAATKLPATYPADQNGRATKWAANALLGRVQMQKGDYAAAKSALLLVKGAGFALTDNYLDNFLEETEFNKESVFEVVYFERAPNTFAWNGTGDDPSQPQGTVRNQEYSPIAWRNLIPSNHFLNEFENTATGAAKTDPRYAMSVYRTGDVFNNGTNTLTDAMQNGNSSVVNGVTQKVSWRKFMLIYKHGIGSDRAGGGINQRMIRYSEVLLMLAECENELNQFGPAVDYLNMVRDRPSVLMPHYPTAQFPTTTKDQITKAIMHEKGVELGGEEIRNRDILRWRKKGYFTKDPLYYFRANRDELLPIPQQEIDNNPKLGDGGVPKQNAGY